MLIILRCIPRKPKGPKGSPNYSDQEDDTPIGKRRRPRREPRYIMRYVEDRAIGEIPPVLREKLLIIFGIKRDSLDKKIKEEQPEQKFIFHMTVFSSQYFGSGSLSQVRPQPGEAGIHIC